MENIRSKRLIEVKTKRKGFLGIFLKDVLELRMVRLEFNKTSLIAGHEAYITHFYEFSSTQEAEKFLKQPTDENALTAIHIERTGNHR